MFEVRERPQMVERALLIGVYFDKSEADEATSLIEELAELVGTLGIGVIDSVTAKLPKINKRYLLGTGKTEEFINLAKGLDCDCIIFDNELSPGQQRAWEEDSGLCVIDRQEVILDIFAMRASTKEARLQVALARMEYSMPRLKRMWAHLDRQGGGVGARGEGETQLETDRRLARNRVERLKGELEEVRKRRDTQRKERMRRPVAHAAIVGYTNAGKSTLLNHLTDSDVLAEDKLFATLDTTTRKVELPDGQHLLLTDTVGFVRRLPHRLVESFKATLEEANLADFLIHVLDASEPRVFEFFQTTVDVLGELGCADKKRVIALNKMDLVTDPDQRARLESKFPEAIMISVKENQGIDLLIQSMNEMLVDRVVREKLRIPQSQAHLIHLLHTEGKVLSTEYEGNDVLVEAIVPKRLSANFAPHVIED